MPLRFGSRNVKIRRIWRPTAGKLPCTSKVMFFHPVSKAGVWLQWVATALAGARAMEKSSKIIIPLIIFALVYVLTTFVFNNENSVYQIATGIARIVFLPAEFLLPFLVFLLAIIKYKRAEERRE